MIIDLELKTASNRSRKAILKDIEKAHNLIVNVRHELNSCDAKQSIGDADVLLWRILQANK